MPYTQSRPRLYYEVTGEGSPVLLIMGLGMQGAVWQPQLSALRERHRVCYYDHRGIGDSEHDRAVWSMRLLAKDAERLLDALGWDRAHVVGVSMGGMVAQELALRHRHRCSSLTLIATMAGGPLAWLPTPTGIRHWLAANFGPKPQRLAALQRLLYPEDFLSEVDARAMRERHQLQFGDPAAGSVLGRQLFAVIRHRAYERLADLEVPTLVVRPERDQLIRPRQSTRLYGRIRGARLESFPDAGHGVIFQSANRLNPLLLDHFAQNEHR